MTPEVAALAWPASRLGHAIEALASKSGVKPRAAQIPVAPDAIGGDSRALPEWMDAAAQWFGLEAEPVDATYETIHQMLRDAGPALIRVQANGEARFFALLGGNRKSVSLLCPSLKVTRVKPELIHCVLLESVEAPLQQQTQSLI